MIKSTGPYFPVPIFTFGSLYLTTLGPLQTGVKSVFFISFSISLLSLVFRFFLDFDFICMFSVVEGPTLCRPWVGFGPKLDSRVSGYSSTRELFCLSIELLMFSSTLIFGYSFFYPYSLCIFVWLKGLLGTTNILLFLLRSVGTIGS